MTNKEITVLWKKLSSVIADEISSNPEFTKKICIILSGERSLTKSKPKKPHPLAKIDPFKLLEQGEDKLNEELAKLSVDELKVVISVNGMDTSKLARKWKDRERLERHIIDATKRRSARGEAFWNSGADSDGN